MTSSGNKPIDVRAREARERLELAVANDDAQMALEAAREAVKIAQAGDYVLLRMFPCRCGR